MKLFPLTYRSALRRGSRLLLASVFFLSLSSGIVRAEEEEETATVIGGPDAETVATGRFSRLVSRTPENVTVFTAEQIREINAHTLSDILAVIPGIQLTLMGGPASLVDLSIEGADFSHVLVLLDGVPFNNLANNFPDVGTIPAYLIERVEIAKGPASSSWGPALGGVINVITRSPEGDGHTGAASVSHGQRGTDDVHGEISGTVARFGYHLSGGYFGTGGFHPNTQEHLASSHNLLSYEIPGQGRVSFAFDYLNARRGQFATELIQGGDEGHRSLFNLALSKPLSDQMELELSARASQNDSAVLKQGAVQVESLDRERIAGGSAKFLWRGADNVLVLGADYDRIDLKLSEALLQVDLLERHADRWGFYLNDSYTLGRLTLAPGVRYDITGTSSGRQWSPSFGATWQAGENTTLRGYVAKGYSVPTFASGNVERVWTVQVGAESSAIPYLWLKGTFFHNDVKTYGVDNDPQELVKRGGEAELKTTPVFHTSLSAGYTFIDARKSSDDSIVENIPREIIVLGARYDDERLLRLVLTGRHVDWRSTAGGRYGGFLWDAHLTLSPFGRAPYRPEFFLSVRNAFDNNQYVEPTVKNPLRWIEGGARCRF